VDRIRSSTPIAALTNTALQQKDASLNSWDASVAKEQPEFAMHTEPFASCELFLDYNNPTNRLNLFGDAEGVIRFYGDPEMLNLNPAPMVDCVGRDGTTLPTQTVDSYALSDGAADNHTRHIPAGSSIRPPSRATCFQSRRRL